MKTKRERFKEGAEKISRFWADKIFDSVPKQDNGNVPELMNSLLCRLTEARYRDLDKSKKEAFQKALYEEILKRAHTATSTFTVSTDYEMDSVLRDACSKVGIEDPPFPIKTLSQVVGDKVWVSEGYGGRARTI